MTIEITCSSCGEEFRVRDEAAGKSFKCKVCGTTIRIPDAADDDEDDGLPPVTGFGREKDDEDLPKRRKKKSSAAAGKTLGPAIGLYVTAGLYLLYLIANTAYLLSGAGENMFKPPAGADEAQATGRAVGMAFAMYGLPLITLFILAGTYCLHTHRAYGVAVATCILASIPCCSPICIFGIPFGVWGLVVLNQEDVKRLFS